MTDVEHGAHDPAPAEPAPELLVGGSAAYACMWHLVRQARTAVRPAAWPGSGRAESCLRSLCWAKSMSAAPPIAMIPVAHCAGVRRSYEDLMPKEFARENGMVLLHDSPETAWLVIADLTQRTGYREVVTNKFDKRVALLHAAPRDLINYLDRNTPPKTIDKVSRMQKEAEEARRRYLLATGLPADSPTKRDS